MRTSSTTTVTDPIDHSVSYHRSRRMQTPAMLKRTLRSFTTKSGGPGSAGWPMSIAWSHEVDGVLGTHRRGMLGPVAANAGRVALP